jgi:ubiquinone/menaquinone biosynthesis C-methylase UbiE
MPSTILERVYPEARIFGFTRYDGTIHFFLRVQSLLQPSDVVLDVGCGRGLRAEDPCPARRQMQDVRGPERTVIGIDVDSGAAANPWLTEFRQITNTDHWPVEDASVNLIYSDYVLEHVEDPDSFFREAYRVLKPGGYVCLRTPNFYGCVAIMSWLVPNKLHARVLSWLKPGVESRDVFPTVYRCNTRRRLQKTLQKQGFDAVAYPIEGEPGYFAALPPLYRVAAFVFPYLPGMFQSTLLGFAKKPSDS